MVGLILDKERTVNYNHLMYRKVLKTHFLVTMRSHFPKGLYVPDIVEERIERDFPVNWELLLTDNSMTSYFVREGEEAKAQELGFEWSDSLSSKVNTVEHLTVCPFSMERSCTTACFRRACSQCRSTSGPFHLISASKKKQRGSLRTRPSNCWRFC